MDGIGIQEQVDPEVLPVLEKPAKRGRGRPRKDPNTKVTAKVTPKKGGKKKVSLGVGQKGKKKKAVTKPDSVKNSPMTRVITSGDTNLRRSPRLLKRSAVT